MPVRSRRSATTSGKRRQLSIASLANAVSAESPSGARSPAAAPEASAPGVARSSTVTAQPALASSSAHAHPMIPPPTIVIFTGPARTVGGPASHQPLASSGSRVAFHRVEKTGSGGGGIVGGQDRGDRGDTVSAGVADFGHAVGRDAADRDHRD